MNKIVNIGKLFTDNGRMYFSLEDENGETLIEKIELSEETARHIIRKIKEETDRIWTW